VTLTEVLHHFDHFTVLKKRFTVSSEDSDHGIMWSYTVDKKDVHATHVGHRIECHRAGRPYLPRLTYDSPAQTHRHLLSLEMPSTNPTDDNKAPNENENGFYRLAVITSVV